MRGEKRRREGKERGSGEGGRRMRGEGKEEGEGKRWDKES